jgi:hypothetical protein
MLKINEPNIVHETIDNETILMDFKSGVYYSFDGLGPLIWEFIQKTGSVDQVIMILQQANPDKLEEITQMVNDFVEKLIDEKLIIEDTNSPIFQDVTELSRQLSAAANPYVFPNIRKHIDMQDLLLLDPIHDVGEQGWPEAKID